MRGGGRELHLEGAVSTFVPSFLEHLLGVRPTQGTGDTGEKMRVATVLGAHALASKNPNTRVLEKTEL